MAQVVFSQKAHLFCAGVPVLLAGKMANNDKQGDDFIRTLLQAERDAEDMVKRAKTDRLAKIRSAKERAEEDLELFRKEQERKFQSNAAGKVNSDPMQELAEATKKNVAAVHEDYNSNKAKTIDYIVSKIMDVPTALSATQIQALRPARSERCSHDSNHIHFFFLVHFSI